MMPRAALVRIFTDKTPAERNAGRSPAYMREGVLSTKPLTPMTTLAHQSCIDACLACATACNHCAASCLQEEHVKMMARCIRLDMDCAQICTLSAAYMARGSEFAGPLCDLCARVCDACAAECGKHDHEHCQRCAEACRRCADECRRMLSMAGGK